MNSTENTASSSTSAPQHAFMEQLDTQGIRILIESYQGLTDMSHMHAHVFTPLFFARSSRILPPTHDEKLAAVRMLKKEQAILKMMKRVIANLEMETAEMIDEIDVSGWNNQGWSAAATAAAENEEENN
jgi:hypothetical protein